VKHILPRNGDYYSFAVAVLNRRVDGTPTKVSVQLKKIGLDFSEGYRIQELFDQTDYGLLYPDQTLRVQVNPSGN